MKWTPADTGQLLLMAMGIFSIYAIMRGMGISNRRKKEDGQ